MEAIFIAMLINGMSHFILSNMNNRRIKTVNNRKPVPMVRKRPVKRDWVSNIIVFILTAAILVAIGYGIYNTVLGLEGGAR